MRRIRLDHETKRIQRFFRSLPVENGGAVLELRGRPLLRILPVRDAPFDRAKLKTAILKRRRHSREINQDWRHVDRDTWDAIPGAQG